MAPRTNKTSDTPRPRAKKAATAPRAKKATVSAELTEPTSLDTPSITAEESSRCCANGACDCQGPKSSRRDLVPLALMFIAGAVVALMSVCIAVTFSLAPHRGMMNHDVEVFGDGITCDHASLMGRGMMSGMDYYGSCDGYIESIPTEYDASIEPIPTDYDGRVILTAPSVSDGATATTKITSN